MKRLLMALLPLIIVMNIIAGCGNKDNTQGNATEKKKTFIFADTTFNPENSEPDLNPHRESSGWACIRYGVGETLFRYSDAMQLESWFAKDYKMIDEIVS